MTTLLASKAWDSCSLVFEQLGNTHFDVFVCHNFEELRNFAFRIGHGAVGIPENLDALFTQVDSFDSDIVKVEKYPSQREG